MCTGISEIDGDYEQVYVTKNCTVNIFPPLIISKRGKEGGRKE